MSPKKIQKASDIQPKQNLIKNEEVVNIAIREEKEFLSLLLNHHELREDCLKNTPIDYNYFLFVENSRVFAMATYYHLEYNSSITEGAINEILKGSANPLEERNFLHRIIKLSVKTEEYERLKNNLIDRYNQQRFYELIFQSSDGGVGIAHEILNATSNQTELISKFQDEMTSFEKRGVKDEFTKISSLSDTLKDVMEDIADRRVNPDKHYGFLTGFKGIDDIIYGLKPKKYCIVVGYPNGGKTTFMINLALGLALNKARVCYVTVESSGAEIAERMICNLASVPSDVLRKGGEHITSKVFSQVIQAKEKILNSFGDDFVVITVPQKTPVDQLISLIERKRRSKGFDVVFVDYLDVIDSIDKFPGRPDMELGQVSVRLQAYGKKNDLTMITAQSFNNETIKLIKKMVLKSKDGADSIKDDISHAIGVDSVGGSQKLSRDCDFMWGLVMGNQQQRLGVYWMKSRDSKKAEPFFLTAKLDCCKLIEEDQYKIHDIEFDESDLAEMFLRREELKRLAESKEEENMLNNAKKVIDISNDLLKEDSDDDLLGTKSSLSLDSTKEEEIDDSLFFAKNSDVEDSDTKGFANE